MSRPSPKLTLFTQFAAVAKSLAHAHRLEILEQLAQGERSVEMIAQRTGLSVANTSQHLQQMRRAGIVAARREGKFIFYTLADEAVLDLMSALRRIAERNIAEVERVIRSYFNDRDSMEPVSREELLEKSRAGVKLASRSSMTPKRSSPIAAVRIAFFPTRRWPRFAPAVSTCAGWKTAFRSGALPDCQSSPAPNAGAPWDHSLRCVWTRSPRFGRECPGHEYACDRRSRA